MQADGVEDTPPLRVLVVDDVPDVRFLLRLEFDLDDRFAVVGEAADGDEAISLADDLQPDLVILDRNMPGRSGLEAIEPIRRVAPDAGIVLYTAVADDEIHHTALAAGALDVLEKVAGPSFVERLTARLLDRVGDPGSAVEVRVGPVSASAARTWIANSTKIIEACAERRDVVEISDEALALFRTLLAQWGEVAKGAEEFLWVARASLDDVTRIVEEWAVVDAMTDEQMGNLGIEWSPPEGQPFFDALTTGVLRALARHESTKRLTSRLADQWAPYRSVSSH